MSSQSTLLPDLVNFDRVGLRYGRGPEVLIDATLDLPQGSFTFLTGPSGAGKTSLLKLCYLSLKPSRGLIRCLLYTSPSPRDLSTSRMPSSA